MGSIHTERLELIPADAEIAEAELTDRVRFAAILDARVPTSWPPEVLADALPIFRDLLRADPARAGWMGWYAVLTTEGERILVGSAGFTGPPDEDAKIETGYSMIPEYQGRGIATEMVRALCAWAFAQPGVTRILAATTSSNAGSVRVLEKAGFTRIEPVLGDADEAVRFARFSASSAATPLRSSGRASGC